MKRPLFNLIKEDDLDKERSSLPHSKEKTESNKLQSIYERLWLTNPEQFNPEKDAIGRLRIARTVTFLEKHLGEFKIEKILDIGSGSGELSRAVKKSFSYPFDSVDIAENALKVFRSKGCEGFNLSQSAMPWLKKDDQFYDLVLSAELIADIPKDKYRLFFAELARLVKKEGAIFCSTEIDIDTTGGIEKLQELALTEFDLLAEKTSYHSLYLKIRRLLKKLGFLGKKLNCWLEQNETALLILERISCYLFEEEGASHYMFLGKLRPLIPLEEEKIAEKPKKRQSWDYAPSDPRYTV